jgi:hypothetical protein
MGGLFVGVFSPSDLSALFQRADFVEIPQLVRKAVRPSHITQSKQGQMETNIDGDLYVEHTKEIRLICLDLSFLV